MRPPHRGAARRRALAVCSAAPDAQQAIINKQGQRVIVIGAGAGGLATAGRLARAGLDVTVLEKNAEASGPALDLLGCPSA